MFIAEMPWSVPLTVRFHNGTSHIFSSVFDALDFLENEWPLRRGQRYERAVKTCRGALHRTTPVAVAREAFIAACLEADLPVAGPLEHMTAPQQNRGNGPRAA
ncbi:DUF982 domain-containing protein [Ensifer sp. 4252]|uniref:DUF982 domain-containing protein n=1 Tax=Ensifer sp. 4252 TaxID=3373915 RepID=UPI003D1E7FA0